jgi:anti-sigma regulatory factor (Ser/Thr protein kinase)
LNPLDPIAVAVRDSSQVGAARQAVQRLARDLEFDETASGRAAIVATEALTNMLKHAGGGTFVARPLDGGASLGIEMLAIDDGPGMQDFAGSARDGVSTTGTPGTGLGAIGRQCEAFDVYTGSGLGTILRMEVWKGERPAPNGYEVGAIRVPKAGETACGDAWAMAIHPQGATFLLADGLGHGPEASRAASAAVEAIRGRENEPAVRLLDTAHSRLRPTRGAAVAVLRHDATRGEITFAGVGNLSAVLVDAGSRRSMVSHSGIVGHKIHRSEEFRYPWPAGALLVAHTDGLESQWDLSAYPGLAACHPSIVAAVLFRKHTRKRDDVAVLVVRHH